MRSPACWRCTGGSASAAGSRPNWAVEHGGLGGTIVEKAIVTEQLICHGIPDVVHTLSIDIVGLAHGDVRHAEPAAAVAAAAGCRGGGRLRTAQRAGDRLGSRARISARAEPDGDGWRLLRPQGLQPQVAAWPTSRCARPAPPNPAVQFHGITVFIVPLHTPGVRVEPLWSMSDERYNEVMLSGHPDGAGRRAWRGGRWLAGDRTTSRAWSGPASSSRRRAGGCWTRCWPRPISEGRCERRRRLRRAAGRAGCSGAGRPAAVLAGVR